MKQHIFTVTFVGLAILFAILFFTSKSNQITPVAEPTILSALDKQNMELRAKDIQISAENLLLHEINKSKDARIKDLMKGWQNSSDKLKEFNTDQQMAFLQAYLEDPAPLRKILISNDTIIGFTQFHLTDVTEMVNDYDNQGVILEQLNQYVDTLKLEIEGQYKQIDNLNKIVSNCDNRVKVKEDMLKTAYDKIEQDKKDAKKKAKRNFFNGLGIGVVGGFIGGIAILIL